MGKRRRTYPSIPEDFPIPIALSVPEIEETISIYTSLKTTLGLEEDCKALWEKATTLFISACFYTDPALGASKNLVNIILEPIL